MIQQQRQHGAVWRIGFAHERAPGGCVRPQGSDQRQRNNAIGSAEIGRVSSATMRAGPRSGSVTNQSTTTIATPEVDQGNRIAISTVSRSTLRIRAAGSCRADQTTESQEAPTTWYGMGHPCSRAWSPETAVGCAVYSFDRRLANNRSSFPGDAKHRTSDVQCTSGNLRDSGFSPTGCPE